MALRVFVHSAEEQQLYACCYNSRWYRVTVRKNIAIVNKVRAFTLHQVHEVTRSAFTFLHSMPFHVTNMQITAVLIPL